jgi:hypothetical protein
MLQQAKIYLKLTIPMRIIESNIFLVINVGKVEITANLLQLNKSAIFCHSVANICTIGYRY